MQNPTIKRIVSEKPTGKVNIPVRYIEEEPEKTREELEQDYLEECNQSESEPEAPSKPLIPIISSMLAVFIVACAVGFLFGQNKVNNEIAQDRGIQTALEIERTRQSIKTEQKGISDDYVKIKHLYSDIETRQDRIEKHKANLAKYGLTTSNYDTGTGRTSSE